MRAFLFGCLLALVALPAGASQTAQLSSYGTAVDAIAHASTITLSAYTLPSRGALLSTLLASARRGAHVSVVLDGQPIGNVRETNKHLADDILTPAGVRVRFSSGPLHMKALVVDGNRVFVSDRNWTATNSLILELPTDLRMTVERAILGQTGGTGAFQTRKSAALAIENWVLQHGSGPIFVETESFGDSIISRELEAQARAGVPVTLVIARYEYASTPSEQRYVESLRSIGIRVFVSSASEKLAVRGSYAWAGSANSTDGLADQVEWGYVTQDPSLIREFASKITQNEQGMTGSSGSSGNSGYQERIIHSLLRAGLGVLR